MSQQPPTHNLGRPRCSETTVYQGGGLLRAKEAWLEYLFLHKAAEDELSVSELTLEAWEEIERLRLRADTHTVLIMMLYQYESESARSKGGIREDHTNSQVSPCWVFCQ